MSSTELRSAHLHAEEAQQAGDKVGHSENGKSGRYSDHGAVQRQMGSAATRQDRINATHLQTPGAAISQALELLVA
jgi:hypothetical protein